MWRWNEVLEMGQKISLGALATHQSQTDPDDMINIQYTSGTTGNPKGVMLTHRNIIANAFYLADGLRVTQEDRACIPVPLYHCFGCVIGSLLYLTRGATMVFPLEYFDPLKTLKALDQERCTALLGVPTMFIAELVHPEFESFNLSSLRTGMMASSPCQAEVMHQVIDRMGAREITIAYGQTEASPGITISTADDSIERRVTTLGRVLTDSRSSSSTRTAVRKSLPVSRENFAVAVSW
jgi:fatty-acyl-CoA synthase